MDSKNKAVKYKEIFLCFLCSIVIWWIASFYVDEVLKLPLLSSPFTTIIAFAPLWYRGLMLHLGYSLLRIGAGIGLAWMMAGILGIAMGRNKKMDAWLSPIVYLLYPIPKIAFLPVILLFLGLGEASRIFIIFLIVFFQILIGVRDKVKEIKKQDLYSIQSLGAGKWDIIRHVVLPYCLPGLYSHLRISMGTGLAVLFIAEYVGGTSWGLGYLIMDAFSRVNYPEMFAAILALSFLGIFLFGLIDILEQITCPWQDK